MQENNVSQAQLECAVEFADRVNRRQSWIIGILIIALVVIVTTFIIYISLPVEESSVSQSTDNITDSEVTQTIGDNYGESDTE